jgi:hypothetical protein
MKELLETLKESLEVNEAKQVLANTIQWEADKDAAYTTLDAADAIK